MGEPDSAERGLLIEWGLLQIDVPRSLGYYGAVVAALAFGVIEPPLGLFIAAVPVLKLLGRTGLPRPLRFVSEAVDGAAQPVGGEAQGTIRLRDPREEAEYAIRIAETADRGRRIKSSRSRGGSRAGAR